MTEREGIVYDLPEEEYHGGAELSSTGAKAILDSPARYKHEVLDGKREHKDAFDLGSVVHAKVLGTGWGVQELEFENWRTKAAQEARAEVRASGMIPMLTHEMVTPNAMAEAVLAHPMARALLELEGNPEASVFATCPDTGVQLRCRFDYLPKEHQATVDLKTSGKKASKAEFAKSAASFGYDVQRGHYLDTFRYATGERRDMVFIVVESAAPHLVAVHQMDREYADLGEKKARAARRLFKECTESGVWPGYPNEIQLIQAPAWAVYDYQENYE